MTNKDHSSKSRANKPNPSARQSIIASPNDHEINHTSDNPPSKKQPEPKTASSKEVIDRWMLGSTIAIAIASLVNLIIFTGQWHVMGRQLDEMKSSGDQTDKLIDAATTSANAAKLQSKISEQTFSTAQRAYVVSDVVDMVVINKKLRIQGKWKNSGLTPANHVKNHVNWGYFANEVKDFNALQDVDSNGRGNIPVFIGPNNFIHMQPLFVPIDIYSKTAIGKGNLYFWGWSEYTDTASRNTFHRTEFCYEIVTEFSQKNRDGKTQNTIGLNMCSQHNCMDEECKKQPPP